MNRNENKHDKTPGRGKPFLLIITLIFVGYLLLMITTEQISIAIGISYLLTSLAAFTLYAIDKYKAQKDHWRIPEGQLHAISLIGGWPGAFIAQQLLRHKTLKKRFRAIYYLTVGVNVALFLIVTHDALRAWLFHIVN